LNMDKGNLATYIKLSILVVAMLKLYQELGLSEVEIGESIYRTAEEYYRLSPVKKWVQRKLFFSPFNRRQILPLSLHFNNWIRIIVGQPAVE
jgi:hypothetical protein